MRAVIIAGGSITDHQGMRELIKPSDFVVCADYGYAHAQRMGIHIDAVIGDFDSLGYVPQHENLRVLPIKKDMTDTQSAIDYARDKGYKDFLLMACTGTRMDHTLANILLLRTMPERGESGCMVDEHNRIYVLQQRIAVEGFAGATLSLIPLEDCYGITTQDLEYPLYNAYIPMGSTLGISNVMLKDTACVTLTKGMMLLIIARD